MLASNIQAGEKILMKLRGNNGQTFVLTDQHVYIIKWGYMTGNTFGGRCSAFAYQSLTGFQIEKGLFSCVVEVLSPATHNVSVHGYASSVLTGNRSNYMVVFLRRDFDLFQKAVTIGRDILNKLHSKDTPGDHSILDLEKLADLKSKGVITEDEFVAKKKQVLGL